MSTNICSDLGNKNRPVLKIPNGFTYIPPKRYSEMQKYCIIFGTVTQAEHPFRLAVIFVPIFQYNA